MGYLHAGHVSLVERAKNLAGFVAVTIFVNPTQFAPGEDLEKYPRDLARDRKLLDALGIDLLFCPSVRELYPSGYETFVHVKRMSEKLCGAHRPNHFEGVATILTKLFHIVQPDIAVFGEKDYQQFVLIKKMARDLDFGIEIVGVPTVREADGLALSSRNAYLSPEERQAALVLSVCLRLASEMVALGEKTALTVLEAVKKRIGEEPLAGLEYVSICDPETLEEITEIGTTALLAMAVWIGRTRLIDNAILAPAGARNAFEERMKHDATHAQG
jgi:pantoate--beta-alanine ligase